MTDHRHNDEWSLPGRGHGVRLLAAHPDRPLPERLWEIVCLSSWDSRPGWTDFACVRNGAIERMEQQPDEDIYTLMPSNYILPDRRDYFVETDVQDFDPTLVIGDPTQTIAEARVFNTFKLAVLWDSGAS